MEDVDELRQQVAAVRPSFCPPDEDVEEFELQSPARDGYMIPMRCYRLKTPPQEGCALIINFHGGGFFSGDLQSDADFCRSRVKDNKAVVVDVDYRLSPEHPFPVPTNDCWDAVLWVGSCCARRNDFMTDTVLRFPRISKPCRPTHPWVSWSRVSLPVQVSRA